MNTCKILDLSKGWEMSSWGFFHFPDEQRLIEFVIHVRNSRWESTRYGRCEHAPESFAELRALYETGLEGLVQQFPQSKSQMICKEGISEEAAVRLVLGELLRAGFPDSVERESKQLLRMFETCRTPRPEVKSRKRFEVDQ